MKTIFALLLCALAPATLAGNGWNFGRCPTDGQLPKVDGLFLEDQCYELGHTYTMAEKDLACGQVKLTRSRQIKNGIDISFRGAKCVKKKMMGKPQQGKWIVKNVSATFDTSNDAIIKIRAFTGENRYVFYTGSSSVPGHPFKKQKFLTIYACKNCGFIHKKTMWLYSNMNSMPTSGYAVAVQDMMPHISIDKRNGFMLMPQYDKEEMYLQSYC